MGSPVEGGTEGRESPAENHRALSSIWHVPEAGAAAGGSEWRDDMTRFAFERIPACGLLKPGL